MKYCYIIPDKKHCEKNNFLWLTHKGEIIAPADMATPHLFNALRMLFNHSVPPAFRVGKFIRYEDVPGWDETYRAKAYEALLEELDSRKDLEDELADELGDIRANADFLNEIL